MATKTPNYKLQKPDADDFYDVAVLNDNWDKLDAAVAGKADIRLSNLTNPAAALARLGARVRPNLLLNPFFAVNQRGQTSYSGNSYGIDRWFNASGNTSVLVSDSGITMAGGTAFFSQKFDEKFLSDINGKTITLTSLWSDNLLKTRSWTFDKDAITLYLEDSLYAYTPTHHFLLSRIIGPGNQKTLVAAKLEFGDRQTLAHQDEDGAWHLLPQPESDYATQLARCQRYQIPIDGAIRYRASQIYADLILFYLPLPVTMVTTPIIESAWADRLHVYNWAGVQQSGFTAYVAGLATGGVLIGMRKAAHGLTDALLYVDAQMGQGCPILSANL